jgi:hypothetical protein
LPFAIDIQDVVEPGEIDTPSAVGPRLVSEKIARAFCQTNSAAARSKLGA